MERRLAAILAADMVGYSRLMAADEAGTIARQKAHRAGLIDPKIAQYGGRIVKTTGDGLLVEFPSVVDAVHCAVEIQHAMPEREAQRPEAERIRYRVGINLGDIVLDGEDILGDGVNIAARLEGLCEPGGICLSRPVHTQVRDKLDLTFEHLGEKAVKNIAEPVTVYRVALDGKAAALATPVIRDKGTQAGRPWPLVASLVIVLAVVIGAAGAALVWWPGADGSTTPAIERPLNLPAIAVLPFDNMSGDPGQDYFSDGITEDLINDLSRVSGLFVIARNSVFTYKGQPVKVQDVGRELGVGYVLEGSVRKAGERVRINAQLVNTSDGRHIWANRYDRDLTDVFAVQDNVVREIVSALAVRLTTSEEERLNRSAKVNPEAYDLLLRGLARFRRFTRDDNRLAREFFERALEHDPDFARAHADVAWSHALDAGFDWSDDAQRSLQLALDSIDSAIAIDDTVPQIHMALANIHRRQRRFLDSLAAARRVIELDPNYADGYAQLANSLIADGQPHEAIDAIDTAIRLNPRNPFFFQLILGRAKFQLGEFEEAAAFIEKSVERNPEFVPARIYLAATYGHLNRLEDAAWQVEEVFAIYPELSLAREQELNVYRQPEDLDRLIEGLRKAGLSE